MLKKTTFLCLLSVLLFGAGAWAQPFSALIYNLETTLTTTCGGDVPIPDGTPIQILWDNDSNGPDDDDPRPPLCGTQAPDSANDECDLQSLEMNGQRLLETPGQFYAEQIFNSCISMPTPARYWLRVCYGDIHWQCNVFIPNTGIQEISTTGWVCINGPCLDCPQPSSPQNVTASDTLCPYVRVSWEYPDSVVAIDSFFVFRDGSRIGSVLRTLGGDFHFDDVTAVSGLIYEYGVEARRVCDWMNPPDSANSSRVGDGGTRPALPPVATNVSASDNACDVVTVTFQYGTNLGVDSFLVKRNGVRVAAIVAQGVPGLRSVQHQGAPAGVAAYTVVGWNHQCGDGTPSEPDNGTNLDLLPPANFQASDDQETTVILTWDDIAGETGYTIMRANQDGSGAAQIGTVGANVLTFTDPNCTPGVIRQYWAYGTGGTCGNGDSSNHDNGSCGSSTPSVPTGVAASDNLCDAIVVTWNDVATETGYNVYRDGTLHGSTAANVTTYQDNTALSGATHSYTVSAFNTNGESNQSAPDNGTRLGIPPAVLGLSATDNSCISITVTWVDGVGEIGYVIMRNGTQVGTVAADVVIFIDEPPIGTYTYTVSAVNACGQGEAGTDQGTRIDGAPAMPTQFTASDLSCGTVNLVWHDVALEDAYTIWRANADGTNPESLGSNSANDTTFDDNTATFGVVFRYWVVAENECGNSPQSATDNGSRITTPAQVTGVAATNGTFCDSTVVTWTDVTGEARYYIWRNSVMIDSVLADVVRYSDPNGAPGTVYSYQVQAVNPCGVGTISTGANGARHAFAAQVSGVTASDDNCLHVMVVWTAQVGIDSFVVFRDTARIAGVAGSSSSYADVSASVGVTYAYTVIAYNQCGAAPVSAADNGTRTSGALPPVANVFATNNICDFVTLTWSDIAGEDSFQVRRDGARIGRTLTGVTTFTDNSAQVGVTYCYTIVAFNVCGEGQPSLCGNGGLAPRPAPPATVTVVPGCPTLEIMWSLSSGALTYTVTRDGVTIATVNHPTDSYVDDPGDNAPHVYLVTAANTCGAGLPSAPVNGQRQGNTPAPTNLAAELIGGSLVTLTWDPTPETAGSIIYRNGIALDTVGATAAHYFDSPPGGESVYYVTAYSLDCGESVPSTTVTVNVTHPAIYGQSFATANLPAGWTVQHFGTTTDPWHIHNLGGNNFAPLTSLQGNAASALEYLISPILDFTGASDLTISFISRMRDNPGAFGYLQASLDSGNTWPFDLLTIIGNDTTILSRHLSVVFNEATGVRFRWKFTGSASQPAAWSIDNVRISGIQLNPPAPATISGFHVADNSNGGVTVGWEAVRSVFFASYELAYGLNADLSDATLLTGLTEQQLAEIGCGEYRVAGLEPNLPFSFAIRMRDQYGNVSDFSEIVSAAAMPEQNGPLVDNPHAGEQGGWWNTEQVVIPVRVIDESMLDMSSLEIRVDVDNNGAYDANETWQPAVIAGQDDAGVLSIETTFPHEGAALRYEFRVIDEWGNIGYSGTNHAEGIADDWSVNVDLTVPEPVESFAPSSWTSTELIQLVWSPSTDLSASHYEIYIGTHPGINDLDELWDAKKDAALADAETYYTTIDGLTPATVYYFRMRAIDAAGHIGEWSEEISMATDGEIPPVAINNLTIHTVMVGDHKDQLAVLLRWSPVSTDVNGNPLPIAGYRVYAHAEFDFAPASDLLVGESVAPEFLVENLGSLPASVYFTVTAVVGQPNGPEGDSPTRLNGAIRR